MNNLSNLSDNDLKEQLMNTYRNHGLNADISKPIKSELYRRGYDRNSIIKLAITSRLRGERGI